MGVFGAVRGRVNDLACLSTGYRKSSVVSQIVSSWESSWFLATFFDQTCQTTKQLLEIWLARQG